VRQQDYVRTDEGPQRGGEEYGAWEKRRPGPAIRP
jgi:hypothetical protein